MVEAPLHDSVWSVCVKYDRGKFKVAYISRSSEDFVQVRPYWKLFLLPEVASSTLRFRDRDKEAKCHFQLTSWDAVLHAQWWKVLMNDRKIIESLREGIYFSKKEKVVKKVSETSTVQLTWETRFLAQRGSVEICQTFMEYVQILFIILCLQGGTR